MKITSSKRINMLVSSLFSSKIRNNDTFEKHIFIQMNKELFNSDYALHENRLLSNFYMDGLRADEVWARVKTIHENYLVNKKNYVSKKKKSRRK